MPTCLYSDVGDGAISSFSLSSHTKDIHTVWLQMSHHDVSLGCADAGHVSVFDASFCKNVYKFMHFCETPVIYICSTENYSSRLQKYDHTHP